jgi:hypothetical protein
MPRMTPQSELDQLLTLISAQADGMGIEAIAATLGGGLQRRSLQRRLAILVAQGRIQRVGAARSARYVRMSTGLATPQLPAISVQTLGGPYVPTSPQGEEIKAYVRQPRACAHPWVTSWRF